MAAVYFPPIVPGDYPQAFDAAAIVEPTGWAPATNANIKNGIEQVSEVLNNLNEATQTKLQLAERGLATANTQLTQILALINWINILKARVGVADIDPAIAAGYLTWLTDLEQQLATVGAQIALIPDAESDPDLMNNIAGIKGQLLDTARALEQREGIDSATPQSRIDAAAGFDAAAGGGNANADAATAAGGAFTGGRRIRRTKRGGYTYGRSPRRSTRRSTPRKAKKTTPTRTRSRRRGKRRGRKRTKGRASTHSRR